MAIFENLDVTLPAAITRCWPESVTNTMTVSRQMPWVTLDFNIDRREQRCLIEALEIVEKPRKITEPTVYKLGAWL